MNNLKQLLQKFKEFFAKSFQNLKQFLFAASVPILFVIILGGIWKYWSYCQNYLILPIAEQINTIPVKLEQQIDIKDVLQLKLNRLNLQISFNTSVFQLINASFFIITAIIAWRNLKATEDKQIAERFSKSLEQLASKDLEIRIGAIYSLERIAKDSPKDHWTIMEVLTAFIRNKSLEGKSVFSPNAVGKVSKEDSTQVTADIQAALTVIGRRNIEQDPKDKYLNLSSCILIGADLRNANLKRAYLKEINLTRANLEGADLRNTNLEKSDLTRAILKKIKLQESNLYSAKLNHANLEKSQLQNAILYSAELNHAILKKSQLQNVDLTHAKLEDAKLQDAKLNNAKLHSTYFFDAKLYGADLTNAEFKLTNLQESKIDDKTKIDKKWRKINQIDRNGAKGENLDGFDFSEAVLRKANLESASLKNAIFDGAYLGSANFRGANLEGASFGKNNLYTVLDKADFNGANLKGATFINASIKVAKFKPSNEEKTNLTEVIFNNVGLEDTELTNTILENAYFTNNCILKSTDFQNANLKGATIKLCNLQGANFEQAILDGTKFIDSDLTGARFSSNYQNAEFIGTSLKGRQKWLQRRYNKPHSPLPLLIIPTLIRTHSH